MSENPIDSFIGTQEDILRFLESYKNDLFYVDINPSPPPAGARHFAITTFPDTIANRVLDEAHPGPAAPRLTPLARQRIEAATRPLECGMNIHPKNGQGWPGVLTELAAVEWVRFPFMSSAAQFPSLEAAFTFFDPIIDAYTRLGTKIILVLNHETYGEAAGWNWATMTSAQWANFSNAFTVVAERIAIRYGNRIAAYEIWNEGDAPPGNEAAVSFPARDYARLLDGCTKVIRPQAPGAKIILGGLMSSPQDGARYVNEVKNTLGRLPVDGIGVHPYGLGAPNDGTPFSRFGNIQASIDAYTAVAPNIPLWLTEVGATGNNDPQYWDDAALYLRNLYRYLKTQSARVPVAVWFAWSDAMHVSQKVNGLVTADNQRKDLIYNAFFQEACG